MQFAAVADRQLRQIEADLRSRRYRFLPVRRIFVAKLTGGRRRLGIPAIRDRVVEQAMRLVLEPVVSTGFAPVSFAYCSRRGVHQAIDRLLQQRREGNSWILESDVQDFFDTIRHPMLLGLLHGLAIDEVLVGLVADFLGAGSRLGGRWFSSRCGVPQGSPLSPMLANLYLTPFDHALVKQNYELIRYADDLVICCGSRREAQEAQEETTPATGPASAFGQRQEDRHSRFSAGVVRIPGVRDRSSFVATESGERGPISPGDRRCDLGMAGGPCGHSCPRPQPRDSRVRPTLPAMWGRRTVPRDGRLRLPPSHGTIQGRPVGTAGPGWAGVAKKLSATGRRPRHSGRIRSRFRPVWQSDSSPFTKAPKAIKYRVRPCKGRRSAKNGAAGSNHPTGVENWGCPGFGERSAQD